MRRHRARGSSSAVSLLLPLIDYGLRRAAPAGPFDTFQDLSMAVAIVSVLPLLMARLAVERAELRQVDAKLRLMGAAVEEANELIVIVSRDGQIRHANRAFCQAVRLRARRISSTGRGRRSWPTNRCPSSRK